MTGRVRTLIISGAMSIAVGLAGFGLSGSMAMASPKGETGIVAVSDTVDSGIGVLAPPATATFYANGDKLVVCDRSADGHGAYAQLYWNGFTGRTNRADGNGDCSTATGNIAEGTAILVRACLVKAGVVSSCGAWVSGRA